MSDQIGNIIRVCATRATGLGEMLAADIEPARFARQPVVNARVVKCNHPAFVYGHLSLYPHRILGLCGLDAGGVAPPDAWSDLFKAGAECVDDPEGTIYPAKDELVTRCIDWSRRAIEAVAALPDAKFAEPNPAGGKYSEIFPTLGIVANFMLNDHAMMHFGQISTWRRVEGLGSVM